MIDFHSGEIKDIMPVNLRTPQALAISYAVGQAMARFRKYLKALPLYAQISQVPEEILDLMAVECGTQYYSQALPRNVKEKLIIQALTWYMHAGTPSVLSEFLGTVLKHMRELMKKQKFFQAMKRRSAGNWKFIKTYGRIWKALQLF